MPLRVAAQGELASRTASAASSQLSDSATARATLFHTNRTTGSCHQPSPVSAIASRASAADPAQSRLTMRTLDWSIVIRASSVRLAGRRPAHQAAWSTAWV